MNLNISILFGLYENGNSRDYGPAQNHQVFGARRPFITFYPYGLTVVGQALFVFYLIIRLYFLLHFCSSTARWPATWVCFGFNMNQQFQLAFYVINKTKILYSSASLCSTTIDLQLSVSTGTKSHPDPNSYWS